ncbi:MAG: hypothetical protein CVU63_00525 [Deltaproteobacteria bacterium HGW-Deltaproteobacteria-20]|nr:MAG: hypothetical protein CVU63_00525 [Deltaproteobacteria bacterium HGW-Deltaproteobacteria-20]
MKTTASRTLLAFGLSALWMMSCASGDDDDAKTPFQPPVTGGSGGYDAGDGGVSANGGGDASAGSGGTATGGTGGSDAGEEAGPPACATEYKRCDHEFTYPAGSETSVELRGSFKADGWDSGVALTKNGTTWSATVPVPYDFQVTYKYVVDGTTWVIDPNNANTVPDGQGGQKSVLAPQSCAWWSCASDPAPGDCPESTRACDFKFVYPYGGESSVTLKGSFDSWGVGVPMTQDGTVWSAVVDDLGWGTSVQYKFVINGTEWVKDPNNPAEISDGFGGFNSLISSVTCEWWSCEGTVNPDAFDWRDAVLYFVFTDRFHNGNLSNDGGPTGSGVLPAADYQGGDFAGITAKINEGYFTELGVNTLWISPPMDNTSSAGVGVGGDTHMYSGYHGYWIADAEKTEERFGTMTELEAMVEAAHAKDIRVLFDYPMNHVHEDSPVYAQHPDWFFQPPCICGAGCDWDGAEGKRCWFTEYLPDFNFGNTDARDWSVSNALWWVAQTGIDGFRLDAVKHIEDQWLLDLRSRLKNEVESVTQEKFYLVGETFTGDRNTIGYYVKPSMLDGQFEFPLRNKLVSTLLTRAEPLGGLDADLGTYETFYGSGSIMSTFVGNHDVPRPIHFAEDAPISTNAWYDGKDRAWDNKPGLPSGTSAFERLANAFTVLFTIQGVPLIYYGDEIGLPGAGDPDNRRFMQWSGTSQGQNLLRDHIKKLGKIRADHAPLRRGTRAKVHLTDDVYAYKMSYGGEDVFVAVNRSDSPQQASGLPSGALTELLSGSTVSGPSVTVPARSSMILVP